MVNCVLKCFCVSSFHLVFVLFICVLCFLMINLDESYYFFCYCITVISVFIIFLVIWCILVLYFYYWFVPFIVFPLYHSYLGIFFSHEGNNLSPYSFIVLVCSHIPEHNTIPYRTIEQVKGILL